MKSVRYLDAVMKKHGLKNDRQLAMHLGWGTSTVSQYRKGQRIMDDEQCLQLARELGMENPLPIIAAAGMDRAEKTGQRSLWEVFTKAIQTASSPLGIAMMLSFIVTLFVIPDAYAIDKSGTYKRELTTLPILRNCLCHRFSPLQPLTGFLSAELSAPAGWGTAPTRATCRT